MTASWSAPIRVQPNTSVVRAIDRGQWQAPLGSSRGPIIRLLAACRRARVRQGQAFGGAEEAPSLTAAARATAMQMCGRDERMLAAQVEQKNQQTRARGRDKMVCTTLDKESPIQAVCPNWARTDLCGGREVTRVPTAKVVGTWPNRRE